MTDDDFGEDKPIENDEDLDIEPKPIPDEFIEELEDRKITGDDEVTDEDSL